MQFIDAPHVGKPLHIAILGTRGIPAAYGGFETFAEQLSVRLVQKGFRVTVYAEADGDCPPDTLYNGVHVRYRRLPKWGSASVIAYDCACLWDARHKYDVVYMLGYGAAWACWLPRIWGTPVWINVDGLEWVRSKWSLLARVYLRIMEACAPRTATRIIADAEAIAHRFRQKYPRGADCTTIAYGADVVDPATASVSLLREWGLESGRYSLVVARPEPENHVLEIVQGYPQRDVGWPLVIVGDVTGSTPYQAKLLGVRGDQIKFIGAVYDAHKLAALRAHAALYLHGHSVGGTNPSLIEAMACGNLIIAHDNPFNREVAQDGALYFRTSDDLPVLIRSVFHSADDDLQIRRFKVVERVRSNYSWERIVDQYIRLILQAV